MNRPMTQKIAKTAVEIIDRVLKHPCSVPFQNFNQMRTKDGLTPARNVHYVDLSLIRKRTLSMYYKNINEMMNDVYQIQDFANLMCGPDSCLSILARETIKNFEKYEYLFSQAGFAQWSQVFYALSAKFQFKSQKMPEQYKVLTLLTYTPKIMDPYIPTVESEKVTFTSIQTKNNIGVFRIEYNPDDVQSLAFIGGIKLVELIEALNHLSSPSDVKEIIKILIDKQPELQIKEDSPINLQDLNQETLIELYKYTKKKLKSNGIPYPKHN